MGFIRLLFCLFLYVLTSSCGTVHKDGIRVIQEEDMWVRRVIESGNYKIDVNIAQPMDGAPIHLTSKYSLEIRNDSVLSNLPYYGRSYFAPLNMRGGGLVFDQKVKVKSVISQGRKGVNINFQVTTDEDTYKFGVQVSLDGFATIDVLSNKRNLIWYQGRLLQKEPK